jgi:group II intron reverse transcriptase/maturase
VKGTQLKFEDLYTTRLFEKILDTDNLRNAFKLVKRNKGAPGIDGITIEVYEQNLEEKLSRLRQEVQSWSYQPTPVKRVEIPKPNGKGTRNLGIPTTKDRVLHMAIKQVIEPILEPTFSNNSYGFRPGKNQQQAIQEAKRIVESGKEFIVDIDLSKFFDRINHDRLIHRLKTHIDDIRVLRLIGMILRSGVMIDGIKTPTTEGSVQGSPLSPLLSNVVLDELDRELEQRGLEFCRFADDCNIFVATERAADRVMASIKKFIEKKLKLKVNEDKSKTAKSDQVKFLGMTIVNGTIAISKVALNKAMEKVKELIPRGTNLSVEQAIEKINRWYRGWASYFKMTQYPSQLQGIEAHIRRRLRARVVSQQKQKRNLVAKLIKRGVAKNHARNTVYTNRKTWFLSHTKAVEKAYPNKWFTDILQQIIMSDKKLEHWFGKEIWVKLA